MKISTFCACFREYFEKCMLLSSYLTNKIIKDPALCACFRNNFGIYLLSMATSNINQMGLILMKPDMIINCRPENLKCNFMHNLTVLLTIIWLQNCNNKFSFFDSKLLCSCQYLLVICGSFSDIHMLCKAETLSEAADALNFFNILHEQYQIQPRIFTLSLYL
jgi:hypothetical protein